MSRTDLRNVGLKVKIRAAKQKKLDGSFNYHPFLEHKKAS